MRKTWVSYSLTLVFATCLFILVLWIFRPSFVKQYMPVSPLPDFLTMQSNKQVSTIDLYAPPFQSVKGVTPFSLTAKSALLYDLETQQTLFAKEAALRLPVASLTKVMTAVIALENKKQDDTYRVSKSDLVGEDSMGLTEGEIVTLEKLLYGLMLPSGNDAAETLASNYPQGREAFIVAMNDKARALGLKDTHFTNPSGLQGDGNQYSTAYDLFVITRYALANFPLLRTVVATPYTFLPYSENHKAFSLYNSTNLLTTYPGVKGVKTGYTPEAGLCLITYLEVGDHKIIGILLGSNNRRIEMKELLDYGVQQLGLTPPKKK